MKRDKEKEKRRESLNGIKLLPNSVQFDELTEAREYANQIRSYVARSYNGYKEWVGYYVPC